MLRSRLRIKSDCYITTSESWGKEFVLERWIKNRNLTNQLKNRYKLQNFEVIRKLQTWKQRQRLEKLKQQQYIPFHRDRHSDFDRLQAFKKVDLETLIEQLLSKEWWETDDPIFREFLEKCEDKEIKSALKLKYRNKPSRCVKHILESFGYSSKCDRPKVNGQKKYLIQFGDLYDPQTVEDVTASIDLYYQNELANFNLRFDPVLLWDSHKKLYREKLGNHTYLLESDDRQYQLERDRKIFEVKSARNKLNWDSQTLEDVIKDKFPIETNNVDLKELKITQLAKILSYLKQELESLKPLVNIDPIGDVNSNFSYKNTQLTSLPETVNTELLINSYLQNLKSSQEVNMFSNSNRQLTKNSQINPEKSIVESISAEAAKLYSKTPNPLVNGGLSGDVNSNFSYKNIPLTSPSYPVNTEQLEGDSRFDAPEEIKDLADMLALCDGPENLADIKALEPCTRDRLNRAAKLLPIEQRRNLMKWAIELNNQQEEESTQVAAAPEHTGAPEQQENVIEIEWDWLFTQMKAEKERLKLTREDTKKMMLDRYGQPSIGKLSDSEVLDLWEYLKRQRPTIKISRKNKIPVNTKPIE